MLKGKKLTQEKNFEIIFFSVLLNRDLFLQITKNVKNGKKLKDLTINRICKSGYKSLVKLIHEDEILSPKLKFSKESMDYAAKGGHLEIVKYLHYNRTEGCTQNAIDASAENGHLNVIKWLHENRTEGCTDYAMTRAATTGQLHVIKWLHLNKKCKYVSWTFFCAIANGHLDVLKWLVDNKFETNLRKYCDVINQYKYDDMRRWFYDICQ